MPFEIREGEDVIGVDAEIAAVAEKLGVELVVEDMEFESLISALEAGTVDFVGAGMTITDERKEKADFSTGYWTAVQVVTVAADDESVLTVGDLSSLVIGVQSGTTGDFVAEELSNNPDTGIMRYNTVIEAMQDLKNGNIDCVIADDLPSQAIVSQTEDSRYSICSLPTRKPTLSRSKGRHRASCRHQRGSDRDDGIGRNRGAG